MSAALAIVPPPSIPFPLFCVLLSAVPFLSSLEKKRVDAVGSWHFYSIQWLFSLGLLSEVGGKGLIANMDGMGKVAFGSIEM